MNEIKKNTIITNFYLGQNYTRAYIMTIHILVKQGKVQDVVAMLIADPSLINSKQAETEHTPLHIAVSTTNLEMVCELVKFKPNASLIDDIGYNALDCVIYKANDDSKNLDTQLEIIKILIKQCNVDINYINPTDNYHYLSRAIRYKQFKLTNFLLMLGANCQMADLSRLNPLATIAINRLSSEWWHLLLEYGAGINIDFAKLNMRDSPENAITLLTQVTKDKVIIGSTWQDKSITRNTPGFKFAITNFNELLEALDRKVVLNQNGIIHTVAKYLRNNKNEDIRKMIRHFKLHNAETTSLKEIVAANIMLNKMSNIEELKKLPIELREYLLTVDKTILERKNNSSKKP